jgi:signal transduction histidine kinase
MKRLYFQIYLTIVASLVLVVLVLGGLWRIAGDMPPRQMLAIAGELAVAAIPPADAPPEAQQRAIERLAERLGTDVALFGPAREPLAAFGGPMRLPDRLREGGSWQHGARWSAWTARLPDGRWLTARTPPHHDDLALAGVLGGVALVVALAAIPLARRLTRRLERLQAGVESLGAGDLAARVKVEGRDEIATLAASFNRAAERIEALMGAHKLLLANASHELRTPLARIRLGVELLKERADARRKAELERDIAELDQLIDEILLASRLDTVAALEVQEEVDLLALAAEECARYDQCVLEGEPVSVQGDPRLLRRMVRNLIDNANAYGKPPIEVAVRGRGGHAVLTVADHGPTIPAAERERIFEPFYRLAGEASKGAGLGLSLVRRIARRHGGDAHYGTDGGGFTVTMPRVKTSPHVSR